MKEENLILRLLHGAESLELKASDGSRLIYQSADSFSFLDENFVKLGLTKKGIATAETKVQVREMVSNGDFITIFKSLSGSWDQKCLTQNQIIDFCEQLPEWLRQDGYATFFLCKINDKKKVDEKNPQKNLVVVYVRVNADGLHVYVNRLENDRVWSASDLRRVVAPQLILNF